MLCTFAVRMSRLARAARPIGVSSAYTLMRRRPSRSKEKCHVPPPAGRTPTTSRRRRPANGSTSSLHGPRALDVAVPVDERHHHPGLAAAAQRIVDVQAARGSVGPGGRGQARFCLAGRSAGTGGRGTGAGRVRRARRARSGRAARRHRAMTDRCPCRASWRRPGRRGGLRGGFSRASARTFSTVSGSTGRPPRTSAAAISLDVGGIGNARRAGARRRAGTARPAVENEEDPTGRGLHPCPQHGARCEVEIGAGGQDPAAQADRPLVAREALEDVERDDVARLHSRAPGGRSPGCSPAAAGARDRRRTASTCGAAPGGAAPSSATSPPERPSRPRRRSRRYPSSGTTAARLRRMSWVTFAALPVRPRR